jgi:hypothetical protein
MRLPRCIDPSRSPSTLGVSSMSIQYANHSALAFICFIDHRRPLRNENREPGSITTFVFVRLSLEIEKLARYPSDFLLTVLKCPESCTSLLYFERHHSRDSSSNICSTVFVPFWKESSFLQGLRYPIKKPEQQYLTSRKIFAGSNPLTAFTRQNKSSPRMHWQWHARLHSHLDPSLRRDCERKRVPV